MVQASLPLAVSLLESLTRGLTCRAWSFHCYSAPAPREDLPHNSESAMPVERVNVGEIGEGAKVRVYHPRPGRARPSDTGSAAS